MNQGQGQEDYADKGLDAIEKKAGQATGHNVDSTKMRSTNEKIVSRIPKEYCCSCENTT
ncbi:hypothetical protein K431DRAFT_282925 [Polychaeton citri CBS 116435]|uniref:Uncharacterized protein n=1 Tax=Polychaeton citri CBS 116435 TaxID=1314669 RepID=A0A9P4QEJ4_9PEZI|nr:hypothetical protein K431DRAFT_282925 [Polychaeton citri CBS 116435]